MFELSEEAKRQEKYLERLESMSGAIVRSRFAITVEDGEYKAGSAFVVYPKISLPEMQIAKGSFLIAGLSGDGLWGPEIVMTEEIANGLEVLEEPSLKSQKVVKRIVSQLLEAGLHASAGGHSLFLCLCIRTAEKNSEKVRKLLLETQKSC